MGLVYRRTLYVFFVGVLGGRIGCQTSGGLWMSNRARVGAMSLLFCLYAPAQVMEVLTLDRTAAGFEIGVNSSGGRTDWIAAEDGSLIMSYPAGQSFGVVFITFGPAGNPPPP